MNYISVKVANFPGLESHIYIDFRSTFLFELRDFSNDGHCRGILPMQCPTLREQNGGAREGDSR